MKEKRRKNKKGQLTIWAIIALLFVIGIVIYFLLPKTILSTKNEFADPKGFIDSCTGDFVQEAITKMLPQGGYLSPKNYKLYEDKKVAYLCYINSSYSSCINQEPEYIQHLQNEINSYIQPKIKECFLLLKQDLKKRNYEVEERELETSVSLETNKVKVNIIKYLKLSNKEKVQEFNEFSSISRNPLYNLAIIAQDIASQEADFCNFKYLDYMLLHKEISIEKNAVGGGETESKIYIIEDKASSKKLYIAIKSCTIPPGL